MVKGAAAGRGSRSCNHRCGFRLHFSCSGGGQQVWKLECIKIKNPVRPLQGHSIMKFLVLCLVATSLLCAVSAVTYTFYSDSNCASPSGSPSVVAVDQCFKPSGSSFYQKISSCGTKASIALYTDSSCSNKVEDSDQEIEVGKCHLRTNLQFLKLTCDPASSLSVAFLAVVAAVLSLCLF
jgi:hypothetical protein